MLDVGEPSLGVGGFGKISGRLLAGDDDDDLVVITTTVGWKEGTIDEFAVVCEEGANSLGGIDHQHDSSVGSRACPELTH